MDEEATIRQEAKSLKISNWHNKNISTLKQEVLTKRAMNSEAAPKPKVEVQEEDETTPSDFDIHSGALVEPKITTAPKKKVETAAKSAAREYEDAVVDEEKEGNKGFVEAAKEEGFYPFANKNGSRIGLYRRVNFEYDIAPELKDSSYKFIKWADSKGGKEEKIKKVGNQI